MLAAFILEDRIAKKNDQNHNGKWTTYIETLPMEDCFEFPVNYGEEELKFLKGCHRVEFETAVRKLNVRTEF